MSDGLTIAKMVNRGEAAQEAMAAECRLMDEVCLSMMQKGRLIEPDPQELKRLSQASPHSLGKMIKPEPVHFSWCEGGIIDPGYGPVEPKGLNGGDFPFPLPKFFDKGFGPVEPMGNIGGFRLPQFHDKGWDGPDNRCFLEAK
jgi:hypothetical protein